MIYQQNITKALFILLLAPEFYLPLRQPAQFYHARVQAIAIKLHDLDLTDWRQ